MTLAAVYDTKPYDREALQSAAKGSDLEWRFWEFRLTAATAASAKGTELVCAFVNDQLDRACLEALVGQGVRCVALRSTGFNNLDLAAAKELKLVVSRVAVYSPYAVAEHAVALLLTLNRKTHRAFSRVRDFNFSLQGLVGFDLHGKVAGIVGTGKIGQIAAQILRGFGMDVLAYDPVPAMGWAQQHGVRYVDFLALVAQSDVISLHLPLTPDTKHLIGPATLSQMKAGSFLINVSRGALVDSVALIDALKSGHIGAVGLDVYEEEEGIFFEDLSGQTLMDDELARLLTFPNVLITAHQAFLTREALADIARVTVSNLSAYAKGQPLIPGTVLT